MREREKRERGDEIEETEQGSHYDPNERERGRRGERRKARKGVIKGRKGSLSNGFNDLRGEMVSASKGLITAGKVGGK